MVYTHLDFFGLESPQPIFVSLGDVGGGGGVGVGVGVVVGGIGRGGVRVRIFGDLVV